MADGQQSWLESLTAAIPGVAQIITEGAKAYDAVYHGSQTPAPATPAAATPPIVATAPGGPQIRNAPARGSSWIVPVLIVGAVLYIASRR